MRMMTGVPGTSAWQRFAQVPHRAYFSIGVLGILLLALWWSLALPLAGVTAQPSTLVHGLMMPLGIFPPFMLGFVFTAGPRWLSTPAPGGHLPLALAQIGGLLLALIGFACGGHWALPGLLVLFVVWWRATGLWGACIASAPAGDHRHARLMLAAMVIGNLGILAAAGWVLSSDGAFWLLARNLILWGWIVPIFLIVAHRMIPFFTQSVLPQRVIWRPVQLLYGWLAGCLLLVLAAVAQLPLLSAVVAAGMALSFAYTAWRWAGSPGLRLRGVYGGNRLLTMLHLSFAWLPVALTLQALGDLGLPFGSAAAHAIGLGFCSTMMVGFVTRVSMGHSGRPLLASDMNWRLYLGLHAVALLRVAFVVIGGPAVLLHGIALLWLLLIILWAVQMLPLYWRPRADGQPG
ncbi:MAG TPA: NnrS family protein [Rhodocyclaceae bacterium]|nr:NnrS family protein [Rhodocyclaceae bacterium]